MEVSIWVLEILLRAFNNLAWNVSVNHIYVIIFSPHLGTLRVGFNYLNLSLAFLLETLLIVSPISFSTSSLIIKTPIFIRPTEYPTATKNYFLSSIVAGGDHIILSCPWNVSSSPVQIKIFVCLFFSWYRLILLPYFYSFVFFLFDLFVSDLKLG